MTSAAQNRKTVRKAVFPVAGLGTRFLPATKVLAKEMLILHDRPLIQHAIEEAREAGITQFLLVTREGKEILALHFGKTPELLGVLGKKNKTDLIEKVRESTLEEGELQTTFQAEALGLGHAVWCAREWVGNEPFAVILPDDVVQNDKGCLAQMMEQYKTTGGNLIAVEEIAKEDANKYGILDIGEEDGRLVEIKGLVEKPDPADAPSNLAIIGRYILQPEIFRHLSRHETGAGGEIQLTDAIAKMIGEQPLNGYRFEGSR
ncbi:MAG TPA: UTP--glucose-1-phosphate uridylyltransferase, partial [Micavibrio sp.]